MKALYVLLGFLSLLIVGALIVFMIFIGIYNGQKIANEEAGSAWGNVEATQQRRADLVPNLVATVKAYASHEEGTFTAVTEARAKVGQINLTGITGDSAMMAKLFAAQGELSSALSKLMVVAEDYPELKASENFRDLQSQLEGTENRINVARQRYNESAQTVNSSVETFFGAIVAGFSGVEKREYFKASEKAQEVPVVDFE